ncbi:MAG: hypothetical protein M1840_003861 [Geoglossum simile]|nr:MAG: hypothetical protein M1840_003861 [Geoglossum simile]
MPGTLDSSSSSKKRKRGHAIESTGTVREGAGNLTCDAGDDNAQLLFQLESQITQSRRYYNNIATLLAISRDDGKQGGEGLAAAVSLCRVFCRLMVNGNMSVTKGANDAEVTMVHWLKERYDDYLELLLAALGGPSIRKDTALMLLMRLVKDEGNRPRAGQGHFFPAKLYSRILQAVLESQHASEATDELVQKYITKYVDIRFYTLATIHELATEGRGSEVLQTFTSNALSVLSLTHTAPSPGNDIDRFYVNPPANSKNQLYLVRAYKKQAQKAWLALFKLGLSKEQRKNVLSMISSRIAPCFVRVELLMDFLIDSLNSGGSTSLLALSGLFYLIQEKNLDYPMFYPKLYSMLSVGVLHSRHRSRFFRLLDIFLASTHLPAALVASFIKKLSRLSLQAPPSAIVVVVPWIYNLLKRHPTCTFMVHREVQGEDKIEELGNKGMDDPFNMSEEDPMKTGAICSSLWEVQMLQTHYHPNVATLARIISEQFTKHAYNMEDFLDHSYSSMLDAEFSKDSRKPPVVEHVIPTTIFTAYNTETALDDRLLVKMWHFT